MLPNLKTSNFSVCWANRMTWIGQLEMLTTIEKFINSNKNYGRKMKYKNEDIKTFFHILWDFSHTNIYTQKQMMGKNKADTILCRNNKQHAIQMN